jgi:hypothetical protein
LAQRFGCLPPLENDLFVLHLEAVLAELRLGIVQLLIQLPDLLNKG